LIKEYFCNYARFEGDIVVELRHGRIDVRNRRAPDWKVAVVDTGTNTQTGGRIKRLADWIDNKTFMMTYGDGVGCIDIRKLVGFHRHAGKLATITAVRPPSRFGGITFEGDHVARFSEKPQIGEGWINGGFMVLEPGVLEHIDDDNTPFEKVPMERLAADRQLVAFRHEGFWQPMDTLREKQLLESMWESGNAPWKTW
jgi:glucose-1-phosphate cytidylyltransferase